MDVREMSMLAMCLGNVFLGFFAIACQWYFDDRRCRKAIKKDNDKKNRDMKTTTEMIAIMTAFHEGKKIEYKNMSSATGPWFEAVRPSWSWGKFDYRVKEEPKYRPYKDKDECFRDVVKHGGWVKEKHAKSYYHVIRIDDDGVCYAGDACESFQDMLIVNVFADDGSPCGVKEE